MIKPPSAKFRMAVFIISPSISLNYKQDSFHEITIPASELSRYFITIENRELDDPLTVLIGCPHGSADVIIGKASKPLPTELDITSFIA